MVVQPRAAILLLLLGLSTGVARADRPRESERILLIHARADELGGLARGAVGGILAALPGARVVARPLAARDCWPEDPGCAARLAAAHRATRVIFAQISWERAGCVPIRGSDESITGHRMLRRPTLGIAIFAPPWVAPIRLGPTDLDLYDSAAARVSAIELLSRL